jgi:predicted Zn-dependent protease
VRRSTDDEGRTVLRRWLLRAGVVEQPISDALWSLGSAALSPGAGRRANRHLAPAPRSTHLELLAGASDRRGLCAGDGLYLAEAERGALDSGNGVFQLDFACGRRLSGGEPGEIVGPCRVRGRLADLLHRVVAVGSERVTAGAGWCAKGGHKLPVWATAPALRLEGVEIEPRG